MRADVDALEDTVKPKLQNIRKHLKLSNESLESISIPSDFSYRNKLLNTSENIRFMDNRVNIIHSWLDIQINRLTNADDTNKGLLDRLGFTSLVSSMEGNTYRFGANGEIVVEANNYYDEFKSSIKGVLEYVFSGGLITDAVDTAKKTGAKVTEKVEYVAKQGWEFYKTTKATAVNAAISLIKGVGRFGEEITDFMVVLDTGSKSVKTLYIDGVRYLYALATDNTENWSSLTSKMWKNTMTYVAEEHVENAYRSFYDNTKMGRWLDENAHDWFKSDGAGTKFIEGVGYIAPAVAATILTGGAAAPAVLAGGAGAGGAMEAYWGEARDSSWAGIERQYKRGEISQEDYNNIVAIRNLSDTQWSQIKKDYMNGEISKEEFEQIKSIRNMPEDWTSFENCAKGIGYGVLTGTVDAAAWYAGAKISAFTPFKSAVKNSVSRIAIDGGIGTVETAFRSLIDVGFTDRSYDEAWENQGGWSNTILAFGGSAFGEAFDGVKHVAKKIDLSGIKNNNMLKNVGAYISANNPIKSISGIILSPVTLISKFFNGKLYDNIPLKSKALSNGILHFSNATDAILDSGYVRKSGIAASYGKPSSFFFAGIPEPGDIAMNCKLSNKLEAVRIKPTEEVLDSFKYRNLNDEALMWDGDFNFKEMGLEAEKVYVILENNNGKLQYKEVSKEIYDNYNEMSKVAWLSLLEGMAANEQAFAKNIGGKVVKKFESLINKISTTNAEFGIIDPTFGDVLNDPKLNKNINEITHITIKNVDEHLENLLGKDVVWDKDLTPEQKNILAEQINRFNEIKNSDIKRVEFKTDAEGKVILDEGTLLHGTIFDEAKLKSIKEKGILSTEFNGGWEEGETFYCADFYRVPEKMKMKEYTDFCITPEDIGGSHYSSRIESQKLPKNTFERTTFRGEIIPGSKGVSDSIAFIVNPNKEIDDLLKMDVYRDNIHTENMKEIVNFDAIDNPGLYGLKDRLAAPLYGTPENAISGIWVGDDVKLDIDKIRFLEEQFPDLYIIDKEGTIIYNPKVKSLDTKS